MFGSSGSVKFFDLGRLPFARKTEDLGLTYNGARVSE